MTAREMLQLWKQAGLFLCIDPTSAESVALELEEVELSPGDVLFRRGEPSDATYLITAGALDILTAENEGDRLLDVLRAGEPVGELQLLAGGRRTATVRAREPSRLVRLSRATFEAASRRAPRLVSEMAELIRRRLEHYRLEAVLPLLLGPLSEQVLANIERDASWVRLRRGELLFRQGERDQALYVLMRGRLQAEVETSGTRRTVGQIFPGECVGEMALFTGEDRSASVRAARNSELIRLAPDTFRSIVSRHPEVVMQMTKLIIHRLRQSIARRPAAAGVTNLTVLPAGDGFPLAELARLLTEAIAPLGVLHLSSRLVDELLGTPGIAQIPEDAPDAMRVEVWLDEQESRYPYIVYEPDATATPWSWRCVERADRILLAGAAAATPEPGDLERTLLGGDRTPAPRTLVLLHPTGVTLPSGTARWLEARAVEGCVHVRWDRPDDFRRLGRILTGRAVGVVLSGGGAKGFAHIGVLRALAERGIPVDMIGGTSMGSVIAAGYAMGITPRELAGTCKRLFEEYRPFRDYTLPLVSLLRGHRLDRMLRAQTGEARIEDLWIGYFCVSADLTAAEARVHTAGSLFTAVRSSISIPGILPPVVEGDRLLVDGGVLNNLPADLMRQLCGGTVIAVDVAPTRDVEIGPGFAEYPSPWRVLWSRIPGSRHRLPGMPQIMTRTTMLSSIQRVNTVKASADYYLRPAVEQFGMLEFGALDRIVETGYRCALEGTAGWEALREAPAAAPQR